MSYLQQSFNPVYASSTLPSAEIGENSMLIGGPSVYLSPNESWPICGTCSKPLVPLIQLNVSSQSTPEDFRARLPSVLPPGEALTTMLQLFVCRTGAGDAECYTHSLLYSTSTCSWVLRVADVMRTPRDKHETPALLFLPSRLVETWAPGKEETLHEELMWDQDDSEEFYAEHEPAPGLKMLGHSVRGKFHCADDGCPRPGAHAFPEWRDLFQIGGRFDFEDKDEEDEEALEMMASLGNTFIEQCVEHPDVVRLTMSGGW
ncbi:hypothetical protein NLJ89_g3514 [Agrocybe chaxingu]|uniref:Uncharacterized protein n=1 Tax=Agrocybe chaxingu TaxID=84603 RepID=A0A9W8K4S4_9AGAR|nr:hypothetical protein NLJ89_g3514 [Agrocybe chaxingu]